MAKGIKEKEEEKKKKEVTTLPTVAMTNLTLTLD